MFIVIEMLTTATAIKSTFFSLLQQYSRRSANHWP